MSVGRIVGRELRGKVAGEGHAEVDTLHIKRLPAISRSGLEPVACGAGRNIRVVRPARSRQRQATVDTEGQDLELGVPVTGGDCQCMSPGVHGAATVLEAGARQAESVPRVGVTRVTLDRLVEPLRSEERRVGKECGSRWWPEQ